VPEQFPPSTGGTVPITLFNGEQVYVPADWSDERIMRELDGVERLMKETIGNDPIMSRHQGDLFALQQGALARSPVLQNPASLEFSPRDRTERAITGHTSGSVLDSVRGSRLEGMQRGGLKQVGATAARVAKVVAPGSAPTLDAVASRLKPVGADEQAGALSADVATSMLPFGAAGRVAKLAEGTPFLARNAARLFTSAGAGAGTAGAQGHDPYWGAAAGAAMPVIGGAFGQMVQGGRNLARQILNPQGPAMAMEGNVTNVPERYLQQVIADNALKNRAMPGMLRTGGRRVAERLDAAMNRARNMVQGDPFFRNAEINPPFENPPFELHPRFDPKNTGMAFDFAKDAAVDSGPIKQVVKATRDMPALADPNLTRSLGVANNLRREAFAAPSGDVASIGRRGVARDLMDAVSEQAQKLDPVGVPRDPRISIGPDVFRGKEVAKQLQIVKDLMPVQETETQRLINEGGVPLIKNRILASVANRAFSPIAQTMYSAGNVGRGLADSAAMRSAMTSVLNRWKPPPPEEEPY
jgi:hypothetical protein